MIALIWKRFSNIVVTELQTLTCKGLASSLVVFVSQEVVDRENDLQTAVESVDVVYRLIIESEQSNLVGLMNQT